MKDNNILIKSGDEVIGSRAMRWGFPAANRVGNFPIKDIKYMEARNPQYYKRVMECLNMLKHLRKTHGIVVVREAYHLLDKTETSD